MAVTPVMTEDTQTIAFVGAEIRSVPTKNSQPTVSNAATTVNTASVRIPGRCVFGLCRTSIVLDSNLIGRIADPVQKVDDKRCMNYLRRRIIKHAPGKPSIAIFGSGTAVVEDTIALAMVCDTNNRLVSTPSIRELCFNSMCTNSPPIEVHRLEACATYPKP